MSVSGEKAAAAPKHRFLVMKECGQGYYQSWEMLKHGHCETFAEAKELEREWHKKYPKKATCIIETIGAAFTTLTKPTPTKAFMTIRQRLEE